MNDEIKEILSLLNSSSWSNEAKQIEDYITNLQQAIKDTKDTADDMLFELKQENERLNENNQAMQEEMARTWEKCDDYKSRCEKASEYINTHDDSVYQEKGLNEDSLNDLLNILQNGSDDNEF